MPTIALAASKVQRAVQKWLWETMADDDVGGVAGADAGSPSFADKTVHVTGTFGGATVTIEGSNDGTNFVTLNDAGGSALSFTSAGLKTILENPLEIRPKTAGGSGTDVDVIIIARGTLQLR